MELGNLSDYINNASPEMKEFLNSSFETSSEKEDDKNITQEENNKDDKQSESSTDKEEKKDGEQTAEGSKSEENKNKESENGDKKTPLHRDERFKEVYAEKKKYREEAAKYKKELDELKRGQGNLNRNFAKYFSEMSPEEALEKMKEDLYNDAKLKLQQETAEEQLKNEEADEFIQEAFGHLEEKYSVELNSKDQEEISKIIIKYKMTVEEPEDFERAYEIYDLQKKAGGTGKSKAAETIDKKKDEIETKNNNNNRGDKKQIRTIQDAMAELNKIFK